MFRQALFVCVLAPLLFWGCQDTGVVEVAYVEPGPDLVTLKSFNPPAVYDEWWVELSECIAKTNVNDPGPRVSVSGPRDIHWFLAYDRLNPTFSNGYILPCIGDKDGSQSWCLAQTIFPDSIVLAPNHKNNKDIVIHEMTHVWLQDESSNHDDRAFCSCSYNQEAPSYGCWGEHQKNNR